MIQNKIIREDMEEIARNHFLAERLRCANILVTGATGLLGTQIIRALAYFNYIQNTKIHIIAMVRNIQKAKRVFSDLLKDDDITLLVSDINEIQNFSGNIDYIIHGASATSSRYFVSNPVETIITSLNGTKNILELAALKEIKSFLYLSSLEVYGTVPENIGLVSENDYGYIDPLNVRSSYSEGKRMAECLCVSYNTEYKVPIKIARLSQTFGAGVEYNDSRVFAEFARCVLEKRNIVLHTPGRTVRTYCYTRDAVNAMLYILTCGENGQAYNVTNMETSISIRDMAELVCQLYPEASITVSYDMPENVSSLGYNPEMIINLDSSKLEQLGWKPMVSLPCMYKRMIEYMRLEQKNV